MENNLKKEFDPLKIMGIFWLVFGVIVLFATLFVRTTPQVPAMRGIITNIIAGALLVGTGFFSLRRAGANRRRKSEKE
jgi:hypothetical protein